MAWYYLEGQREVGPLEKADLQALIKSKKINGRTLVRHAASDAWKPLAELVQPKTKASDHKNDKIDANPPPPPRAQASAAAAENAASDAPVSRLSPEEMRICSQCGGSFPSDRVLIHDGRPICAACKPRFVQTRKEGVGLGSDLRYAGFWIRFVAKVIDGIILGIVQWGALIPLSLMNMGALPREGQLPPAEFFLFMGIQQAVGILLPAAYNTFFIGKFAATPGKMACRLKVVTAENEAVGYLRALARNFAEWISAIVFLIGYIMAAFDGEKRALHDRICNTRVVHK